MSWLDSVQSRLSLPVIASPMFIVSNPRLVAAECKAGIVGSFPALNARPAELLDEWLTQLKAELATHDAPTPSARPRPCRQPDLPPQQRPADARHGDLRQAPGAHHHHQPAGLGRAGGRGAQLRRRGLPRRDLHPPCREGHRGRRGRPDPGLRGRGRPCRHAEPFALLPEIRRIFQGPIALAGAIANGQSILAAQALGADFAYMGTRFIATQEANAVDAYKQMLVDTRAEDIVYSSLFTGVPGNYLKPSIAAAGMDPDNLPSADKSKMDFGSGGNSAAKAWRDIWGAGQGVGSIDSVPSVAELVDQLKAEYREAREDIARRAARFGA
jgi:nitronate monooxygenase